MQERVPLDESLRPAYRKEIDGLRALAIIAVIVNHFNRRLLPGGYLGVDIFFVISGYVILSSLMGRGGESFWQFTLGFYSRRFKRLLPVLIVFVLFTAILACLFISEPTLILKTGIAALLGVSNFHLIRSSTDYFATAAELNPFTHTWALSVEAQFYLLFPFIYWLCRTGPEKANRPRSFIMLMSALSLSSLAIFIYLYQANQVLSYYLMPARMWELGIGCLLFLGQTYYASHFARLSQIPASPIVGVVVGIMLIPAQYSVIPVVGIVLMTALLIACLRSGTYEFSLLTNPYVVSLGLLSYSLYLWHWSVLSLSRWTIGVQWWTVPLQLMLVLCLAIFSYRFVEVPIRKSNWPSRKSGILFFGLFGSFLAALGLATLKQLSPAMLVSGINDLPAPPDYLPLRDSGLSFSQECVIDGRGRKLNAMTFSKCTVPSSSSDQPMIWAFGDSHIGHLQGLLLEVNRQTGSGFHLIETPGIPFPMTSKKFLKDRQILYNRAQLQFHNGDIVVVSRLFFKRHHDLGLPNDLKQWGNNLLALSEVLASKGVSLVIIGPPPIFDVDTIDRCRSSIWLRVGAECSILRSDILPSISMVQRYLDELAESSEAAVRVFEPFSYLCPSSDVRCSMSHQGLLYYRDKDHLNAAGSASLAAPFIRFLYDQNLVKRKSEL
ncbi:MULTISPECIES: acyltransferase family protein [unclassified Synechococcus]|uniref:acyltransferase family protein n=1 Tax=unclassified Synechococcus TaxID=2626047 RepID=UPI00006983D3|nr:MULTISPECIES: acyltransferase family protein [unclassified Synechococcus]EAQ75806.1 Predicted membrane associated acyltransferase [Synechococcus sp. WH 5701]WFN59540.1 acyltransferase family protein [Synechococcus sp. CCFWC 502]